jgi:hypothetical protein
MSVLSLKQIGVATPSQEAYFECVATESICDRAVNHAILYGARVSSATINGDPSGEVGTVVAVTVNTTVTPPGMVSYVTYKVQFRQGNPVLMQPLQLFRKLVNRRVKQILTFAPHCALFYRRTVAILRSGKGRKFWNHWRRDKPNSATHCSPYRTEQGSEKCECARVTGFFPYTGKSLWWWKQGSCRSHNVSSAGYIWSAKPILTKNALPSVYAHTNHFSCLFSGFRFPKHRPKWVVTFNETGTIEQFDEDDIRQAIKLHRNLSEACSGNTTARRGSELGAQQDNQENNVDVSADIPLTPSSW